MRLFFCLNHKVRQPKLPPKSVFFAGWLALCAAAASCSDSGRLATTSLEIQTAGGESVFVEAEMARTEKERERGFMERAPIPDGTGMIFVFESDQILSFWMKNTPTALSIAYIDSKGKIRDIFDMAPHSLASVSSTSRVRYALEVPQGWFGRTGVSVGDTVVLPLELLNNRQL